MLLFGRLLRRNRVQKIGFFSLPLEYLHQRTALTSCYVPPSSTHRSSETMPYSQTPPADSRSPPKTAPSISWSRCTKNTSTSNLCLPEQHTPSNKPTPSRINGSETTDTTFSSQILDNEKPQTLQDYFDTQLIKWQMVTPFNKRTGDLC
jgi:hypothetical protein